MAAINPTNVQYIILCCTTTMEEYYGLTNNKNNGWLAINIKDTYGDARYNLDQG